MKLLLVCLSGSVAWAATTPTTHRVTVGGNGKLLYDPTTVFANIGEQVQFEFYPQVRKLLNPPWRLSFSSAWMLRRMYCDHQLMELRYRTTP